MSNNSKDNRRSGRSLFGPILLIAVGVYFLLFNMGLVSAPNWAALFQLWPLWLIFVGVNIIAQQAPRPLGSLLSGLVGVTAVAVAGFVLFFSEDSTLLRRLGVRTQSPAQKQLSEVSFTPEDASEALVEIDFNAAGANLYALGDSNALIDGTVTYVDELIFDADDSRDRATVYLDTRSNDNFVFWLNPANWGEFNEDDRWQLGLNPDYDIELRLDAASGVLNADLSSLSLTYFELDSASGSSDIQLPEGDYEVDVDSASGGMAIVFPENGRLEVAIDAASGSIELMVPEGMAARVDLERASGSFNPDGRFELVEGSRDDDGVWQTSNYEDADDRLDIRIDAASGSIRIDTP